MGFGIQATFDSTYHNKWIDLNGVRSFRHLRNENIWVGDRYERQYYRDFWFPERTPGSDLVAIPTKSWMAWNDRSDWLDYSWVNSVSIDNGASKITVALEKTYNNLESPPSPVASFKFFETLPAGNRSGIGAWIDNGTDFTLINEASRLGFIVWKGDFYLNGSWTVPADIPNRDSCLVFANWNNPGIGVDYNDETKQVTTVWGGAQLKILVVSSGFFPPMTNGFGILIKNEHGQNVLANSYAPIHLPHYFVSSLERAYMPYWLPMVGLGRHGRFFWDRRDERATARWGALRMQDNGVWVDVGMEITRGGYKGTYGDRYQFNAIVPCIDGARYF